MNFIVTAIITFLSAIWTFASSITLRLPIILAYLALIVIVTTAYLLTANNIIDGIHKTVPTIVLDVWGWVMPSNAIPCLLALITARIHQWTYAKYAKVIEEKAKLLMMASVSK